MYENAKKYSKCPLKNMPYNKKYNTVFDTGIFGIDPKEERAYIKGWNDCVDEILSE